MVEWTTFGVVKDLVLFGLAIYAAILSTWNLNQAINKDRRVVRVTAGSAMPTYANGELGNTWASLKATNAGQRPVTITLLAFELDTGGRLFTMHPEGKIAGMADTSLPITLSDGQSAQLFQSYRDIGQALLKHGRTGKTKLTPICEDSSGGIHRGEHWDVDPHEFMGM